MSNNPIVLRICAGTTCYVMGGSELLLLDEQLPDDLEGKVQVEGATCMGWCRGGSSKQPGQAPWVMVDGKAHGGLDVDAVVQLLRQTVHEHETVDS